MFNKYFINVCLLVDPSPENITTREYTRNCALYNDCETVRFFLSHFWWFYYFKTKFSVIKSTFSAFKISPKNQPRLIHRPKIMGKKSIYLHTNMTPVQSEKRNYTNCMEEKIKQLVLRCWIKEMFRIVWFIPWFNCLICKLSMLHSFFPKLFPSHLVHAITFGSLDWYLKGSPLIFCISCKFVWYTLCCYKWETLVNKLDHIHQEYDSIKQNWPFN